VASTRLGFKRMISKRVIISIRQQIFDSFQVTIRCMWPRRISRPLQAVIDINILQNRLGAVFAHGLFAGSAAQGFGTAQGS
jgi:hypothetical protein